MAYSGELAALATALCWAFGSLFFTLSGRAVGSGRVNRARLLLALVYLLVLHRVWLGTWFPVAAGGDRFLWLGLSGLVGYVIGDGMLFESFVIIGPRMAMLLMTMVPVFAAALAWIFMGEHLAGREILAILVTLAGIAWVVGERGRGPASPGNKHGWGIALGLGGAMGQAAGLLLAKRGLAGGFSAVSGNLLRVGAAVAAFAVFSVIRRDLHLPRCNRTTGWAWAQIGIASLLGPVIGVVLSLFAIAHTQVGIASTLMSLSPLILIPLSHVVFGERIGFRSVAGTILALAGSALFFVG